MLPLLLQDAPTLQWKFQPAKLTWTTSMKTRMGLSGKEYSKQEEKEKVEFDVKIVKQNDDGSAVLRISVLSVERMTDNPLQSNTLSIKAKRVENADPEVKVTVDSKKMTSSAITASRQSHETVYKNLFGLVVELTVDKTGSVTSKRVEGDLLRGIRDDDVQSKFFALHLKRDLTADDLSSCLAAQAFLRVPEKAIQKGDVWKTSRSFSRRMMDASGEFEAGVKGIEEGFVEIREKGEFRLNGKRFADSMVESMLLLKPASGFKMTMNENQAWPVEMAWWFNPQAGRVESFSLKGRYEIKGEYSGHVGEQVESKTVELTREVEFGMRWR
jgi:hypothetical protein